MRIAQLDKEQKVGEQSAALEREAIAEGVSLNQLVVDKLSVGLGRMAGLAVGEPADAQNDPANPVKAV